MASEPASEVGLKAPLEPRSSSGLASRAPPPDESQQRTSALVLGVGSDARRARQARVPPASGRSRRGKELARAAGEAHAFGQFQVDADGVAVATLMKSLRGASVTGT
jgi:hypothetical protein